MREPGNSDRGEQLFNGPLFRARGSAAGGLYTTARAYAAVLGCLLAGGSAPGGAILARETVDEYLAPQLGELPGEVAGVGTWDALAWGLGFDVRGTREPHWTGSALSASASSHFGAAGTLAWLDRELGAGLVVLANRGTYSGWWRGAGGWGDISAAVRDAQRSSRCCAACRCRRPRSRSPRSGAASCRSSSSQPRFGAPVTYQRQPLSARIIP